MEEQEKAVANLLFSEGICSSRAESIVFAEAIVCTDSIYYPQGDDKNLEHVFQDILDLTPTQAKALVEKLQSDWDEEDSLSASEESNDQEKVANDALESDEKSDAQFDGECELCDRSIKLTKHHLIPRATWKQMYPKLLRAAEAKEQGDLERAVPFLGPGWERIFAPLSTNKSALKHILHETCNVCRTCHNTIHNTHSNADLALYYNSVELLLQDEQISKYCKWASKQKTCMHW